MNQKIRSLAVFNQAGGVGKTTLTRDVGYELSRQGFNILLIDADAQGTLGAFFGLNPAERPVEQIFWSSICGHNFSSRKRPCTIRSEFGVDLGLSNRVLYEFEVLLAMKRDPGRVLSALDIIVTEYDLVLFDCSPKISEIIIQILQAVDALIIPVQTEGKAVKAFAEVQLEIEETQQRRANLRLSPLEVVGVVPTLYDPQLVLHRHHLKELQEIICPKFGYDVFGPIRRSIRVAEAGTQEVPLFVHDPRNFVNDDIRLATGEIQKRLGLPLKEVRREKNL